ncbi:unnamed protein product [Ophioblennius macclurei]
MVIYYPTIEIPLLCICIVLWIFCCHVAKKRREAEGWSSGLDRSPSVYIIPMYEENQEEEEGEGGVVDMYEAYFQSSNSEPPIYSSRDANPPPPYTLEPPAYPDPPPSYTDPSASSEHP